MVLLFFNAQSSIQLHTKVYADVVKYVHKKTNLTLHHFYLEQNGKRLEEEGILEDVPVFVRLRILGGKGGFGSMLRAIGAQIEKTTNREACRDLSGRRLRDINEEKRLKAWLEKQGEREREAEERKKRKIEKLLAVPKHEFKDDEYEEARSKLTEKVCDAVEEGLKKSTGENNDLKRRICPSTSQKVISKKKKTGLWIDDDLSDDSDSDSDFDTNKTNDKGSNVKVQERFSCASEDTNTSDSAAASVASK